MLTWASANSCPIAALKWVKVAVISALTPEINPSLYIMPKPFKHSRSPCFTPRSNQALPSQDQLSRPLLEVTSASDMRQLPHHDSLSLPACGFGGLFGHTRSAMRLKYFPVAVMVNYVKSLRAIPSATCSNCCDRNFSLSQLWVRGCQ